MIHDNQIREHVRKLRVYYTNLVIYGCAALACMVIWLLNGGGAFWPVWPIMAFGLAAGLQGARLGQLQALKNYFPFLSPEWEEAQVKLMSQDIDKKKPDHERLEEKPVREIKSPKTRKNKISKTKKVKSPQSKKKEEKIGE